MSPLSTCQLATGAESEAGVLGILLSLGSLHSDQVGQLQCSVRIKVEDIFTVEIEKGVEWFFIFFFSRETAAKVHFSTNVRLTIGIGVGRLQWPRAAGKVFSVGSKWPITCPGMWRAGF